MLIGYVRVSKSDGSQVCDLQKDALIKDGVSPDRIYEDRASGRLDSRPGLDSCLQSMREGDTLVVWKLDRLGRNLKHLIDTVEGLRNRNIGFKVLTGQGAHIDTTTPNGKLIFGIFSSLAAMSDRNSVAKKVAERFDITTSTLYSYVNSDGTPKELGERLLNPSPQREAFCMAH